ncbi:MAG: DUF1761 domain-containing protein [Pseudomonadota bacterium]
MEFASIQILEILAGTFVGMILGAFWYSPVAFGPAWMACIGKTSETIGSQTLPMIGSVVASFLTAIGVSVLSASLGIASLPQALTLGFSLGFLIVFPALLSDNLFCGWGNKLLLIQTGYRVLAIILMSVAIFYV